MNCYATIRDRATRSRSGSAGIVRAGRAEPTAHPGEV